MVEKRFNCTLDSPLSHSVIFSIRCGSASVNIGISPFVSFSSYNIAHIYLFVKWFVDNFYKNYIKIFLCAVIIAVYVLKSIQKTMFGFITAVIK